MKSFIPLLGILAAMTGCASTQVNQVAEVPVSRVVMYQSGIGYVERTGTVDTDELVLSIRPDQINDILKSLTVIDRGNGRPVSISLPVDRDTLDTLAEIPEQVQNGGIKSLLSAFRGAHVKLKTRGSSYEGRIVGVEEPKNKETINVNSSGDNSDQMVTVTLLTDGDRLEVVHVADVKSVEIYDRSLADGLDKSLNISLNEGDWKQVELRIRMDSSKSRELALSYLVAMPTWKPAYRLIIEDDEKGTLQGWAIISNVTGSDWENISFSLVSGQPMSFTYDLYTPQFLERPDLSSLAETKAAAPKIVGSSMNAKPSRSAGYGLGATGVGGGGFGAGGFGGYAQKAAVQTESMKAMAANRNYFDEVEEEAEYEPIDSSEMIANFSELASKAQIGSFDEYRLASRLTIPDGNTALVNLIQNQLEARDTRLIEKPSISDFDDFGVGWRETKSYQTIELKNSAGVALDAGPITIYRDSAVIGEGYLSRTEKDATAYITFANEGRLTVSVADTTTEATHGLESFKNGVCKISQELSVTNHFEFDSRISTQTTALLQLPQMTRWTPVNFPESAVKKSDGYVISVSVPANEKVVQPLTMKSKNMSTYRSYKNNMSGCLDGIKHSLESGEITGDLVDKFNRYVSDSEKRIANQDKLKVLKSRKNEISEDQKQLTETIDGLKSIKSTKGDSLKNQLLDRQKANEKELAEITTEIYTLQVENGELELSLKELERTINYSRK
ncbi:MAG: hypothetical protein IJU23_06150 [Proteobacteria bacterium]|nr:hypothetical protein [Pseudomonadota bacterium]